MSQNGLEKFVSLADPNPSKDSDQQCANGTGSSCFEGFQTNTVPPLKEQLEIGWLRNSNPEKEVTWLTPIPPQLAPSVPTPEHAVLEKVNLFGCTKWDPTNQQEASKLLEEYADVFNKDDLDLGQTSVVKHKITLTEGAKPIKECYRRVPPALYDEVQKYLQEMMDIGAI